EEPSPSNEHSHEFKIARNGQLVRSRQETAGHSLPLTIFNCGKKEFSGPLSAAVIFSQKKQDQLVIVPRYTNEENTFILCVDGNCYMGLEELSNENK
ncbi:hypothetical protein AVEN_89256-1, partial [Araneus ventricosus]